MSDIPVKQWDLLIKCEYQKPKVEHLILSSIEVTAWLAEPDILGVPLSKLLDNHEIPRAERVAFVQRNRGVYILEER